MLLPVVAEKYDVVVAAHGDGPLRDAAVDAGVRFVPLTHVRRPVNLWRDLLGFFELVRLCRRVRPDIVHANSSKAGVLSRLAAAVAGVPIRIFSVHGWAFSVPGMSRIALWADRLVCPLTTATICVAEYDRPLGTAARTCVDERTVVIHNGIDAGSFKPSRHHAREAPLIVSVGRIAPQKDFATLVHALAALGDVRFRAQIVGSGPDERKIEHEIRQLGLDEHVMLYGERRDVRQLLAGADIFALSSIYESLPISILEAMAARLPVVASAVGGVPELVIDGETGFLVPSRDPKALADRLEELLADRELRRRFGDAGRARVLRLFDIRSFQDRHIELYERELDALRRRRQRTTSDASAGTLRERVSGPRGRRL
jgi:glycosyltransferase involved in cell wall biosynthesis